MSDFLKPQAVSYLTEKTKLDFGKLQCYKVFPNSTSNDTASLSHFGKIVKHPPFYATFGILLPQNTNDTLVFDNLLTSTPYIYTVTYNHVYDLAFTPNDPLYNDVIFPGLTPSVSYPDANINIEPAWDYEMGDSGVVVGVYDSGINKIHEDLSLNGTISTSTVKDGYDYLNQIDSYNTVNTTDPDFGHGTSVAGIIGARSNNGTGISGIAGGDNQNYTPVTLHDMKLFKNNSTICEGPPTTNQNHFATAANIANALHNGGNGIGPIEQQQLIMNHSWAGVYNFLIKEQFIYNYKKGITSVAASGNRESWSINGPCSYHTFPASFIDNMIIKTGGSDLTGAKVGFSQCGAYQDVIAPAIHELYTCLDNTTNTYVDSLDPTHPTCSPDPINGTSFAAPHVTGVAALMQSYYRRNVNNPNYQNTLSPEDIEQMMERNATDITTATGTSVGYDDPTGYGRLNAGNIFDSLKYPEFLIYHVVYSDTISHMTNTSVQMYEKTCLESIDTSLNIPLGVTTVNRYRYEKINNHTIPTGYTLIDAWARGSESDLYGVNSTNSTVACNVLLPDILPNAHLPEAPNPSIIHFTANSMLMRGYIYELLDSNNNTVGWLPMSPQKVAKFAYTLYLHNPFASVNENETVKFILYPNPSTSNVTIEFKDAIPDHTTIFLTDITGKHVKTILDQNLTMNEKKITFEVSNLAKGVYFIMIKNKDGLTSKKLIIN